MYVALSCAFLAVKASSDSHRSAFIRLTWPKVERYDGVINFASAQSLIQCANICLATATCDGINYNPSHKFCALHNGRVLTSYTYPTEFDYYEIQRLKKA